MAVEILISSRVGWEPALPCSSDHITDAVEEEVRRVSNMKQNRGALFLIWEPGKAFTSIYYHEGLRLVSPVAIKEQALPEPTLAQKFLAGIPEDVLQRVATVPLKEWLQEMIIAFATDDAHEVYPLDFFSEGIMDLAGGADAPEFQEYSMDGTFEGEDLISDGADLYEQDRRSAWAEDSEIEGD